MGKFRDLMEVGILPQKLEAGMLCAWSGSKLAEQSSGGESSRITLVVDEVDEPSSRDVDSETFEGDGWSLLTNGETFYLIQLSLPFL